jgi:hypothetical protein
MNHRPSMNRDPVAADSSGQEMEGDRSIFSGQESVDQTQEAAWRAAKEHGRAGVGRPRKDSKAPTLAQLGLTKWTMRRAQALAAATEEEVDAICARKRGHSVTSLVERQRRQGRRRNPLFRAWNVAMKDERQEFIEAIRQMAFFAEREAALNEIVTDDPRIVDDADAPGNGDS